MRSISLMIFAAALSVATVTANEGPPVETKAATEAGAALPTLEIMTFNLRYPAKADLPTQNHWSLRIGFVADVIRAQMPDIMGVQEALRLQLDDLAPHLPEYAEIGVGRDDGKQAGEYSAILYKKDEFEVKDSGTYWLSDTPEVPGSHQWNNVCPRMCTWARFMHKPSGKTFYFFNTHWDNASEEARTKGSKLMAERIQQRKEAGENYIVTGDFNCGEGGAPVESFKTTLGIKDSYRLLHPDAKDSGTAHGWSGKQSVAKIDYIFLTPDIQALEAEIIHTQREGKFPSDHFPVRAKVRFLK